MHWPRLLTYPLCLFCVAHAAFAEDLIAPGSKTPFPRIIAQGPQTRTKALEFSPEGTSLFSAGWDKLVYKWDLVDGNWQLAEEQMLSVPIGGGLDGVIEAMSLSADGEWLAVGGRGVKRGVANSRQGGVDLSAAHLTDEQRLDEGTIYLFHLPTGTVKLLRGHRGAIIGLNFADVGASHLVSVAEVWNDESQTFMTELAAWDASTQRQLGRLTSFDGRQGKRQLPSWDGLSTTPGICINSNPSGGLKVGISWPDGDQDFGLRIWDVESKTTTKLEAGKFHFDIDVDPAQPRDFLISCADMATGQGEVRRLTSAGSKLIHQFGVKNIPIALQCAPDGDKLKACSLVVDWDTKKSTLRPWSLLNGSANSEPAVDLHDNDTPFAVAGQGLAWSGSDNQTIEIQHQSGSVTIQPRPFTATRVGFVKQNDQLGLRFQSGDGTESVFDLQNRQVSSELQGWNSFDRQEQTATVDSSGKVQLKTTFNGKSYELDIPPPSGSKIPISSEIQVCVLDTKVPSAVVAFNHRTQPYIQVYDLEKQSVLRVFSAHTGPILDMAVSQDQKLLMTSSRDMTVRLWWLGDLDEVDRFGGFPTENGQPKFEVTELGAVRVTESGGGLQVGDILSTIDVGDGPREVKTAQDCFYWLAKMPPGTDVTLKTQRGEHKFESGQAVVWRRDLLAIVTHRSANAWNWLAWHPTGTYDHHGTSVEDWLHWHFNTGDPEQPARIAKAEQYNTEFSRSDFLIPLLESGKLPPKPIQNPPMLSVSMWDREDGQVDSQYLYGYAFVRRPSDLAKVSVAVDDFPVSRIDAVHWTLTDPAGAVVNTGVAEAETRTVWSFPVSVDAWRSGFYALTAELVVDGEKHAEWSTTSDIRYQPMPPRLQVGKVADSTDDGELNIPVTVTSENGCQVVITNDALAEPLSWELTPGEHEFEAKVPLEIGFNNLELVASNATALEGHEKFEQAEWQQGVIRNQPSKPIFSGTLTELQLETASGQSYKMSDSGESIEVGKASCSLSFVAKNTQETLWRIQVNDQTKNAEPSDERLTCDFNLTPGVNTIRVLAAKGNREQLIDAFEVNLVPAVPSLGKVEITRSDLVPIAEDWSNNILVDGLHSNEIIIECPIEVDPTEQHPYDVQAIVNGQPAAEIEVETRQGMLRATWKVPVGSHRLQFRVANEWGRESHSEPPLEIKRLVPPKLVRNVQAEALPGKTLVLAKLEMSPSETYQVKPALFHAMVNGTVVPLSDVKIHDQSASMTIPGVPNANNKIQVWLEENGKKIGTPLEFEVDIAVQGNVPQIDVIADSETFQRNVPVGLKIQSDTRLMKLKIGLAANDLRFIDESLWQKRDGYIEVLADELKIQLKPGTNTIFVLAENEIGCAEEQFEISYLPEPVGSGSVYFESRPEQTISFNETRRIKSKVDGSTQFLNGSLELDASDVEDGSTVQVWVNGFLQGTEELRATQAGTHEFRAQAILTQPLNHIELVFSEGVKVATNFKPRFQVECSNPTVKQVLYLVVIDASKNAHNNEDHQKIRSNLLKAVQARQTDGEKMVSDAFQKIEDRFIATGLPLRHIEGMLNYSLKKEIENTHQNLNSTLPVTLVYYRGQEEVYVDEHGKTRFGLFTAESHDRLAPDDHRKSLLTDTKIRKIFSKLGGAHLLVLDLENSDSVNTPWAHDPFLGVFRFAKPVASGDSVLGEMQRTVPEAGLLGKIKAQMESSIRERQLGIPDFFVPTSLEQLRMSLVNDDSSS